MFFKIRISQIGLAALLSLSLGGAGIASEEVQAPWIVSYHDGSANGYRFWQDKAGGEVRWEYSPVTPAESSTGMYSGGKPQKGLMNRKQADELWHWVRRFRADPSLHAESRMKGTGAFKVKAAGEKDGEFIVEDGALLRSFNDYLAKLKNQGKAGEAFPVYPGAEKKGGGATSIQPGKNYTLTVYWVAKPLAEVVRFYEEKLPGLKSKEADGSVKFTTTQGAVVIRAVEDRTQINISQGPQ